MIGSTGSGTSTLAAALAKGIEFLEINDDGDIVPRDDAIIEYNGTQMFEISNVSVSCTKVPGYHPLSESDDNIFIVDCPSEGDTNETDHLPNSALIK